MALSAVAYHVMMDVSSPMIDINRKISDAHVAQSPKAASSLSVALLPAATTVSAPPSPPQPARRQSIFRTGSLRSRQGSVKEQHHGVHHGVHHHHHHHFGDEFSGPISKTISYIRSKMDTALSTSSLYPSKEEIRLWETCFESLLNHKFGCALFRQFLKKEFSDENVDFWLECEEFKRMKEGKKATNQRAHEIYKEFVAEQAPKEVNLDSDTRAATKAALETGCKTDTFSLAQSRIEQLMEKDSYRRFLKDPLYQDLLKSTDETGGTIEAST